MLVRKSVSVTGTQMHLRDEADNYVHSYDREHDKEMCAFLDKMVALDLYEFRSGAAAPRLPIDDAA